MRMIRLLFSLTATPEDVNAILKRSFVIVFGRTHIYMREPSADPEQKVSVHAYWPTNSPKDLLSDTGIQKLRRYCGGDKTPPDSDADDRAWQLLFIKRVLHGETIQLQCYTRTQLDDTGVCTNRENVEIKPTLKELMDKRDTHDHQADPPVPQVPAIAYIPGQATSSGPRPLQDADEPLPKRTRIDPTQEVEEEMDIDPELAKELEDAFMEAPTFEEQANSS